MSKAEIARSLSVLPQYLNSIIGGSRGVTDAFIDKFCEVYEITQIDLSEAQRCQIVTDAGISNSAEIVLREMVREKDRMIVDLSIENGALKEKINYFQTLHRRGKEELATFLEAGIGLSDASDSDTTASMQELPDLKKMPSSPQTGADKLKP